MPVLPITVRNKVATYTGDTAYICGNSDYTVVFTLDAEWDGYGLKTARFVYGKSFVDVVFDGTVCTFPKIENANHIQVGIFAGDLHTTTGGIHQGMSQHPKRRRRTGRTRTGRLRPAHLPSGQPRTKRRTTG